MYTRLLRYDTWHFSEVDPVRLRRKAIRLRDQLNLKIKKGEDTYSFYDITMPVIEAAIKGRITQSLDGDEMQYISRNYFHDKSEGTLPPQYDRDFTSAVAGFDVTVQGLSLEQTEHVLVDGVTYGKVEFEEEGDWPDKVKFP